jgi:UDP-N-acetylglucosamine 2-epimerase (non-hydrolysing)
MTSDKPSPGQKIRVLAVAGARPNFMKIAPLLRQLRAREGFAVTLVHTGQHYDSAMSDSFFRDLGIPEPDVNLGVGSGPHGEQTAQVLSRIEPLIARERPHALVVVGDVNSTLAATLAAVKLGVPVAHVEAGLRSFDREMPEEINRLMTDAVSHWLFTTEATAGANLEREGIPSDRIHFVGNVMIDTLLTHLEEARALDAPLGGRLPAEFALLTLHRPSNVDDPTKLRRLFAVLEDIHAEIPVVFPVHPRTAAAIREQLGGAEPKLLLTEPLGYLDFLRLMADSKLVLTDSGGIQEETTALGVTCLTLRDSTERPITVDQGTNTIVGSDPATIRAEVRKVLDGRGKSGRVPALWDGHAAARIIDVLERDLRPRG